MGNGHELLLVDHDSESVLRRFITAVVIDQGHFATPETDIIIGGADVECGGTVQGIDGDQVLDTLRLYILDKPVMPGEENWNTFCVLPSESSR